jgi:ubiquinone/menaquinone biosynthesis C-methylase UbiE
VENLHGMEVQTAIKLIEKGVVQKADQTWADVGAGKGLFTRALSTLLTGRSKVYAVDQDASAMKSIVTPPHVQLISIVQDFEQPLSLEPLDGVIMANALHYVADKRSYLRQLASYLKPGGNLILLEYDTDKANRWVPYPLRYDELTSLVSQSGVSLKGKLGEVPSAFRAGNIYSALLQRQL